MKTYFLKNWGVFVVLPCVSIGYDKSLEGGYWIGVTWMRWTFMALWETDPWGK